MTFFLYSPRPMDLPVVLLQPLPDGTYLFSMSQTGEASTQVILHPQTAILIEHLFRSTVLGHKPEDGFGPLEAIL
jgi:hypothetical protein